jgi:hypothetical protein
MQNFADLVASLIAFAGHAMVVEASPRCFLDFDTVPTLCWRYSSGYCGGDLPTRLMTRG